MFLRPPSVQVAPERRVLGNCGQQQPPDRWVGFRTRSFGREGGVWLHPWILILDRATFVNTKVNYPEVTLSLCCYTLHRGNQTKNVIMRKNVTSDFN